MVIYIHKFLLLIYHYSHGKVNDIYGLYDSHVDFVTYHGINSFPQYGNDLLYYI